MSHVPVLRRIGSARAAAIASGLSLVIVAEALARRNRPVTEAEQAAPTISMLAPDEPDDACPAGALRDDVICIPVPAAPKGSEPEHQRLELLPGRSADPADYVTPIAGAQARQASDGRGLFVAAPPGTPVLLVELEAQRGAGERVADASPSAPLVTLHRVERSGSVRHYLLVYGGVEPNTDRADGDALGWIEQPAAGAAGLTLWARQLRHGVDPAQVPLARLLEDSHSLDCDPRNALPARDRP